MKKLLSLLTGVIALLAITFSSSASPYVAVSALQTTYNYSAGVGGILDDSSNGFSVAVGTYLNPADHHWAVEFEYTDFGSADRTFFGINTAFEATAMTLWASYDFRLATIGGLPLDANARIGITRADADVAVGPFTLSDNDTGLSLGLGAKLWVSPATAITLSYREHDLEFATGGGSFDYDPSTINLGIQYNF